MYRGRRYVGGISMADKMMRIAGRTSGGTAVPMLADSNGNIGTTRAWKKEWVTIQTSLEIRDTSSHSLPVMDVSEIPTYSLRFLNRLGVPVTITFLSDVNQNNGYSLIDSNAVGKSITLQPTNDYIIITPEDCPILNYIQLLRLKVKASSTPSSGTFEAHMVTVR